MGGTLHGAASAACHRLFQSAEQRNDVTEALAQVQRESSHLPGFGHKVYVQDDPRYGALMAQVRAAWGDDARLELVDDLYHLVKQRTAHIANIDFALGALTWLAGMSPDAGEAVFAIARTAGWIAHGVEEFDEVALRFRPRARYVGPVDDHEPSDAET